MKDYYQVLQVSPSATQEEIKKSFRRLALQYHPDKNPARSAAHRYEEIQEAWQTLKDRDRRTAYNFQRYINTPNKQSRRLAQNAGDVLEQTNAFVRKTSALDPFRADLDIVLFEARDLLSSHNLSLVSSDEQARTGILQQLVTALSVLSFPLVGNLAPQLIELAGQDQARNELLKQFMRQSRAAYFWNRYKIVFALVIAILFCLLLALVK